MQIVKTLNTLFSIGISLALMACLNQADETAGGGNGSASYVDYEGVAVSKSDKHAVEKALPYSDDKICEQVVLDHGNKAIRIDADKTLSFPELMKKRENCFIVMSKKDYYLYVYEAQGTDTVMLARFDCAFGLKKGNKERKGDMRTPNSTLAKPFTISQLADASTWHHDFKDGRGSIKAYGDFFLRLVTPPHSGIGIHGSTNNAESVPGRASEGCIRLRDADIITLRKQYAFKGMKVIIKAENVDDYPFEIRAMRKQQIERLRHLDPAKTLSNEQIQGAKTVKNAAQGKRGGNMTLEQLKKG